MSIRTQLITADELLRMSDDGNRRELVSGELREMTPAGHEHGRYTMRFSVPLGQHVEEHNLDRVYCDNRYPRQCSGENPAAFHAVS
jgi:Uma2 family endonuclease